MTRMEPTFIKAGEAALYYNKMMDYINDVADKRLAITPFMGNKRSVCPGKLDYFVKKSGVLCVRSFTSEESRGVFLKSHPLQHSLAMLNIRVKHGIIQKLLVVENTLPPKPPRVPEQVITCCPKMPHLHILPVLWIPACIFQVYYSCDPSILN